MHTKRQIAWHIVTDVIHPDNTILILIHTKAMRKISGIRAQKGTLKTL